MWSISLRHPWMLSLIFCTAGWLHAQQPASGLPPLNQSVLGYVQTVMDQQVGSGECWDLADQALNRVGASWDGAFAFGQPVDGQQALPGDIIQFKGVKLTYEKDGYTYVETMKQHTAIITEVISPGVFRMAHQNTASWGRKVGESELDLGTVTKGKVMIYRPQKG
jgi:hypothetical protein